MHNDNEVTALEKAADAAEAVVVRLATIAEGVHGAIQKKLREVPEAVRADPSLMAGFTEATTTEIRTAALDTADTLVKTTAFHERVGSFLAPDYVERYTRERCLSRLPFHKDEKPEALMAEYASATPAELVGLLDDSVRADRGAVAVLLYRAIGARAGLAAASENDRNAAKRAGELLARLSCPEFDRASAALRRLSAAQKWVQAHRATIQNEPSAVLRLQAHRRGLAA